MTIKQLQYYMEIARCLNFSEAARRLYISQSALSRSVAALEDELGVKLLLRSNHGVQLSAAGLVLATTIPKLAADLERCKDLVRQAQEGMRGQLTLGLCAGMVLPEVLSSALDYFRDSLPYLEINPRYLDRDALEHALNDGSVDLACLWTNTPGHFRQSLKLARVSLELAARESLCPSEPLPPDELMRQTLIFVGNEHSEPAVSWIVRCRSHGVEPKCLYCDSTETQLMMLGQGWGMAILPENHRAFQDTALARIELADADEADCVMVWNPGNLNPVLDVFVKLLSTDL